MLSLSSKMSSPASVLLAGSMTRPFLIRSIRAILCGVRSVCRCAADQMVEQGHAYRDAVRDRLEHAGLRSIGHGRIDFQAADDRAGMKDQSVGLRQPQARGSQLLARDVLVGCECWLVNTLGLDTQNHHDVGTVERFVNAVHHAQVRGQLFKLAGNPHGRAAECDQDAKLAEKMNIRSSHTAVQDVTEDRDVPALEFSLAVANRQCVKQGLGGVFMRTIAGVYDGNLEPSRYKIRRTRGCVANHDSVRTHRFERAYRVQKRFTLL